MFSYGGIFRTKKTFLEFLGVWNPLLGIVNIFLIICRLKVYKKFWMFHNCYTLNFLPIKHKYSFVTFENSTDNKKYWKFWGNIFYSKNRSAYAFSQTKKPKRPTIQKNTQNKDTFSKSCMIDNLLLKIILYNCYKPISYCQLLYLNLQL